VWLLSYHLGERREEIAERRSDAIRLAPAQPFRETLAAAWRQGVVATQIYIGRIPDTAGERRALRERALELLALLRAAHQPAPTAALLSFSAGAAPPADTVDLLLLRPRAIIAGVLRAYPGPIAAAPGQGWTDADGAPLVEAGDISPLELARMRRDAIVARLGAPGSAWRLPPAARVLGAVIVTPRLHPDSRISLDVDDHRLALKVFGLDELTGVASMAQSNVQLGSEAIQSIAGTLGGTLWMEGARTLFELTRPRFRLRLLDGERAGETLPLAEGETVVGRRRSPRRFERRVAVAGDDLISSDHAVLLYEDGSGLTLRDTSKNGTWVTAPGEPEQHLRGAERRLEPGAELRMGLTRMVVERIEA
jgi:hypothetical protein